MQGPARKIVTSDLRPISRVTIAPFFNPPCSQAHRSKVSNNKVTQSMKVEQRFKNTLFKKRATSVSACAAGEREGKKKLLTFRKATTDALAVN